MTPELRALIVRVADTGGPIIKRTSPSGDYYCFLWPDRNRPIGDFLMLEAVDTHPYAVSFEMEGAVIAAIKADLTARSWGWKHLFAENTHTITAHDQKITRRHKSASNHREALAWLLLWLAAFENPDANQ